MNYKPYYWLYRELVNNAYRHNYTGSTANFADTVTNVGTYNFYNNKHSYDVVDPYGTTDGGYWVPSGDTFLVYPGADGKPCESIRLNALREAVDDIRALRAYEARFGRAATESLIMDGLDTSFDFKHYPTDPEYLINLRERIAKALT